MESSIAPATGQKVDFLAEEGRAREIYLIAGADGPEKNAAGTVFRTPEKVVPAVIHTCYLASLLYGITLFVGVIIAYVYRRDAEGSWYGSHYDYQIAIFWKALIGFVLGFATIFFGIGAVILLLTYLWVIFKTVQGWRQLAEGRTIS